MITQPEDANAAQLDSALIPQDLDVHAMEIHHIMKFQQEDVFNATYHQFGIQQTADVLTAQLDQHSLTELVLAHLTYHSLILQRMHAPNVHLLYQSGTEELVLLAQQELTLMVHQKLAQFAHKV